MEFMVLQFLLHWMELFSSNFSQGCIGRADVISGYLGSTKRWLLLMAEFFSSFIGKGWCSCNTQQSIGLWSIHTPFVLTTIISAHHEVGCWTLEITLAWSYFMYNLQIFLGVKALLLLQNASINPDSFSYLLCSNYASIIHIPNFKSTVGSSVKLKVRRSVPSHPVEFSCIPREFN